MLGWQQHVGVCLDLTHTRTQKVTYHRGQMHSSTLTDTWRQCQKANLLLDKRNKERKEQEREQEIKLCGLFLPFHIHFFTPILQE